MRECHKRTGAVCVRWRGEGGGGKYFRSHWLPKLDESQLPQSSPRGLPRTVARSLSMRRACVMADTTAPKVDAMSGSPDTALAAGLAPAATSAATGSTAGMGWAGAALPSQAPLASLLTDPCKPWTLSRSSLATSICSLKSCGQDRVGGSRCDIGWGLQCGPCGGWANYTR